MPFSAHCAVDEPARVPCYPKHLDVHAFVPAMRHAPARQAPLQSDRHAVSKGTIPVVLAQANVPSVSQATRTQSPDTFPLHARAICRASGELSQAIPSMAQLWRTHAPTRPAGQAADGATGAIWSGAVVGSRENAAASSRCRKPSRSFAVRARAASFTARLFTSFAAGIAAMATTPSATAALHHRRLRNLFIPPHLRLMYVVHAPFPLQRGGVLSSSGWFAPVFPAHPAPVVPP